MSYTHSTLVKKTTTTTETEFFTGCSQCDCPTTTYPWTSDGTDTDHCVQPLTPYECCCEPLRLVKKEKDINIVEEYAACQCPWCQVTTYPCTPSYETTPPEVTTIPDEPGTTTPEINPSAKKR